MAKSHWELAIDRIYPSRAAFERAAKERPLRIYHGIDITGSTIHIGHGSTLRVLRRFQDEGHQVVFLFGDFTSLVGDPTGKDKTRPMLTELEVSQNQQSYKEQLGKVLDLKKIEFHSNSEWYRDPGKMGLLQTFLSDLAIHFTVQQLWERDMFQERMKLGRPVTLAEFIYPTLQAYDSVALDADGELGATDQTFNMLAGRDVKKKISGKEKFVITTKLLSGTDGRKMSKSLNNYVGVTDDPRDMFGKLMTVKDSLIPEYFALAAGIDPDQLEIKEMILADPRKAKARMALEVVTFYHGAQAAEEARLAFDRQFKDREIPTEIPGKTPSVTTEERLTFFLVDLELAQSKSEAMRLVAQRAVSVDGAVIEDPFALITPHSGMVIKVGKRRYVKISLD